MPPKCNTPYGYKRVQGLFQPVPREQRVIKRIIGMHEAGMTPTQIATQLEKTRSPTQNGGVWHNEVVRRILRRAGKIR